MALAENQVVRVLFSEEQIARRTREIAEAVKARAPDNLLVVAIMKGSFMFAADLIRALHRVGLAPHVEFMHLSSYKTGTTSSGKVDILRDIDSPVQGRHVLIVDDILESGWRSMSASYAPTSSWSGTEWMWPIPSVSCPMSASSRSAPTTTSWK